ncbi:MAG: CaiB/BaiF CoA-transferase family protein [Acidobacteriota bacterium]|nr:CaiB/BaiF CoA-transferase family protein [Acidobacteriota bacterium]
MTGDRPLDGILVVAIEQAVAAPLATCRLADAGARVIKVEREGGDFARGYDGSGGVSAYFAWLNRGKESIVLDIKDAEDRTLLERIVERADVFIQNLAPGAAARAGFGSKELGKHHPRLITCDISGYGEEGPYRSMRAYDLLVQAESGVASITGSPAEPGRVGVSICDFATGIYAYSAILEALIERERTGAGRNVEATLFHTMADWMAVPLLRFEQQGLDWPRVGLGHPTIVPYGLFQLSDGDSVLIGVQNDREFVRLCNEVLDQPELAEAYPRNVDRANARDTVEGAIRAVFLRHDRASIQAALNQARIAYGFLNDVAALSRHPQLRRARQPLPDGTEIDMVAPAAVPNEPGKRLPPVPELDEHGAAIRAEFGTAPGTA